MIKSLRFSIAGLIAAAMGGLMANATFASVVSPSKPDRADASPAADSRWFWLAPRSSAWLGLRCSLRRLLRARDRMPISAPG